MNKTFLKFFILFLIFLTQQGLADNKLLPIAIENFPPFEFEKNGKIIGFDTEIVVQVLKRAGYEADIFVQPWARAQANAKTGKTAALYSLTKNPEREKYYYFSKPLSTVKDVFFKLKKRDITWDKIQDLKNYRIGTSLGYSYAPVFMNAVKNKKLISIDPMPGTSPEHRNLIKLKAGRIDILLCEVSVCQYYIRNFYSDLNMIDYIDKQIGDIRSYHIGFSKKWPNSKNICKKFNAELKKFILEGKRKPIFKKYGVNQ